MKNYKYYATLISFFAFSIMTENVNAQTLDRYVVASAGSQFVNGGYSIDYTLGETLTQTFTNGQELSQGFQQVWLVITAIEDPTSVWNHITLYPNPAIGIVNIKTDEKLNARLYDLTGKLLQTHKLNAGTEQMDISSLPQGNYFLILSNEVSGDTNTFKLRKVQ